jgi:pimeloyl-ACP methyl ester carboxylesterase
MTHLGWIEREGLRLAVHGADADGPLLVFQHGLCGDARQTAEALGGVGRSWRTLECRGHGASDMGPPSMAAFADDVAAMVEALDRPVALGGISMGAAIACRLAVTRPDLVRALVLVRPAWVTEPAPPNMAPNAEVGSLLARVPADEARQAFTAGTTARRLAVASPDNLASLVGFFSRAPQADTSRLLTAISADGPGITSDDLRALRVPALVLGTTEDAIHPLAHAEALAALIPGARLVRLPPKGRDRSAHFAALAAAISQFLNEV